MQPRVSIVMPVLNEAGCVANALESLQAARGGGWELIVVDGGSRDQTVGIATPLCDGVLRSAPGRARQMNAGAAAARSPMLCFLHADTRLSPQALRQLDAIADQRCWGRFALHLDNRAPAYRVIGWFIRMRSRLTGVVTGDQVLFVHRDLFQQAGGYPAIPLMEDVALSKALRHIAPPRCLAGAVVSSARRWERDGLLRTVLLMWRLRWQYYRGASPERLARVYRADG